MQDSDLEYLIWQFDKRIILSEKKPPLGKRLIDGEDFVIFCGLLKKTLTIQFIFGNCPEQGEGFL